MSFPKGKDVLNYVKGRIGGIILLPCFTCLNDGKPNSKPA